MRRETLSDGTTVDLRDSKEVTQRGRRGIQAIALGLKDVLKPDMDPKTLLSDLGLTEEQADAMLRMQEATVVAFLAGWSRPEPVPTLATIGDIPGDLFDEISKLTAKEGASLALDTTPSTEPDPKGLSGSSDSSDGSLKDGASVTELTPRSQSDGGATATAG